MSSNKVALGLMAMLGVLFALQVSTCQGSPFMDPYFPESDEVEIVNLPEDQDQMDPNNNVNSMPTAGLKGIQAKNRQIMELLLLRKRICSEYAGMMTWLCRAKKRTVGWY